MKLFSLNLIKLNSNKILTAVATATSMSASSKIISGDLPPVSRVTLFMFDFPAIICTNFATFVEPVNDIMSTSMCSANAAPVTCP